MRTPLGVISNDWHLEESSLELVYDLVLQEIALAKQRKVRTLIGIGDFFDNRKAQKEEVLNTFGRILDEIYREKMQLIGIPGNHDKTDYTSSSSFLDPFKDHPAFILIREPYLLQREDLDLLFIPFFLEEVWKEKFVESKSLLRDIRKTILFSHTAVNGSVNNDHVEVECSLTPALFKDFKQVFLGHYHNYQEPSPNVVHFQSIAQRNFGENPQKGFNVLYTNGEWEFVKSNFKEYKNFSYHATELSAEKINEILLSFEKSDFFMKVKVVGPQAIVSSLDLGRFKLAGIKIDVKSDEIVLTNENPEDENPLDFSDKGLVLNLFESFCEERGLDREVGLNYLSQIL